MATFVIHLYRLNDDVRKLTEQLRYHQERLPKKIINFNLDKLVEDVQAFPFDLDRTLRESYTDYVALAGNVKDKYGNDFKPIYRYAEITYSNLARIEKIRLLGVDGAIKKRFYLENIVNPFSITTLRLIQNIREIVKSPLELNLEELFTCKRDAWAKDSEILSGRTLPEYRYTWDYLTDKFFSPKPIYDESGELSDAQVEDLIRQYEQKSTMNKRELEAQIATIESNKAALANKAKNKVEKVETPVQTLEKQLKASGDQAGDIIRSFIDRYSIGCLLKEALLCIKPSNLSCRALFENLTPAEVLDRLAIVFPRGGDTFLEIERAIEEQILGAEVLRLKKDITSLKQRIEENKELLAELRRARDEVGGVEETVIESINNLNNRTEQYEADLAIKEQQLDAEIERLRGDLKLSDRQAREIRFGGGNLAALIALPEEGESVGLASITGKIIAVIDTIIPLEDLCEALVNSLSFGGFEGFTFQFPQPPKLNDLFEGISLQINQVFVQIITQALVAFIDGLIRDLINCDNLDNFIAGAINSGRTGQTFDGLKELFGGESAEDIVDKNYNNFISTISTRSNSIFTVGNDKVKIDVGLTQRDVENLLTPPDFATTLDELAIAGGRTTLTVAQQSGASGQFFSETLAMQAQQSESNWDIDITGKKFETILGTTVFDIQQVDQFLADLTRKGLLFLEQRDKFSTRALAEASGVSVQPIGTAQQAIEDTISNPSGEVVLNEQERETIKEEMVCTMRHITSILLPSQVLTLLAGTASAETVRLAAEITRICGNTLSNILPNDGAIANMFNNFGSVSGLNNLADEVEILANAPEFLNSITSKCGPYQTVEDFREDLLSRVIEPARAREIMEELSNERQKRFTEIGNKIIDAASGNITAENQSNPNEVFLNAIKSTLTGEETKSTPPPANKNNLDGALKEQMDSIFSNSPVIQNMLKITLDSFFFPLVQTFNDDMSGLVDAFSEVAEVEEPIERTITLDSPSGSVTVINPEFKELLNNNLVPILKSKENPEAYASMVEKDALKTLNLFEDIPGVGPLVPDDFKKLISIIQDDPDKNIYISGEPNKNYLVQGLNGVPVRPVLKKNNKKIVGDLFKKNIGNFNLDIQNSRNYLKLELNGRLETDESKFFEKIAPLLNLNSSLISQATPSWNIVFEESKTGSDIVNKIAVKTEGSIYTPINGREDFYIPNFSFTQSVQNTDYIGPFLERKYSTKNKIRKDVFDNIFFEKLSPFIYDRENANLERDFAIDSYPLYRKIVEDFAELSAKNISETRLLAKLNNKGQETTLFELLNFTTNCEHILDFEGMRKEFSEIYSKLPEVPTNERQRMGLQQRPSRLAKASLILLSKLIIKIMSLEVIIKSLPALDYYEYSKNLIQGDMLSNLVSDFVSYELERLGIRNLVFEHIEEYYKITDEIDAREKLDFKALGFNYPLELKKMVKKEFPIILEKIKKIIGVREQTIEENDFINFIMKQFDYVDVHFSIGIEEAERETILDDLAFDSGFITQRYVLFSNVLKNSRLLSTYSNYFTGEKIDEINNWGVLSFQKARSLLSEIYYNLGVNFKIYDCDDLTSGLFEDPPIVGLRIVHAARKSVTGPQYIIRGEPYPYFRTLCQYSKAGYIKEKTGEYDLVILADQKLKINQTEVVESFLQRDNLQRYELEFYPKLLTKMSRDLDANLLFCYALPIKELTSILMMHTQLVNNSAKMKYLFEPSKKRVTLVSNLLKNLGNKSVSSNRMQEIVDKQVQDRNNIGNPGGPLDFDALKLYFRTPIQLLKGVATVVDPNIAIADKIIAAASLIASFTGNKIFLPYSAVSLALLPFPIFTPPPAGVIPPLTSYNITVPIGPIFLALEPLLWDLPYFKFNNSEALNSENNLGLLECEDKIEVENE